MRAANKHGHISRIFLPNFINIYKNRWCHTPSHLWTSHIFYRFYEFFLFKEQLNTKTVCIPKRDCNPWSPFWSALMGWRRHWRYLNFYRHIFCNSVSEWGNFLHRTDSEITVLLLNSLKQSCSIFYVVRATPATFGLHVGNMKFNTENEEWIGYL
jgi:hypothetical protein